MTKRPFCNKLKQTISLSGDEKLSAGFCAGDLPFYYFIINNIVIILREIQNKDPKCYVINMASDEPKHNGIYVCRLSKVLDKSAEKALRSINIVKNPMVNKVIKLMGGHCKLELQLHKSDVTLCCIARKDPGSNAYRRSCYFKKEHIKGHLGNLQPLPKNDCEMQGRIAIMLKDKQQINLDINADQVQLSQDTKECGNYLLDCESHEMRKSDTQTTCNKNFDSENFNLIHRLTLSLMTGQFIAFYTYKNQHFCIMSEAPSDEDMEEPRIYEIFSTEMLKVKQNAKRIRLLNIRKRGKTSLFRFYINSKTKSIIPVQ